MHTPIKQRVNHQTESVTRSPTRGENEQFSSPDEKVLTLVQHKSHPCELVYLKQLLNRHYDRILFTQLFHTHTHTAADLCTQTHTNPDLHAGADTQPSIKVSLVFPKSTLWSQGSYLLIELMSVTLSRSDQTILNPNPHFFCLSVQPHIYTQNLELGGNVQNLFALSQTKSDNPPFIIHACSTWWRCIKYFVWSTIFCHVRPGVRAS